MRVHHLNCGSFCPRGRRLLKGDGGLLDRAHIVCHCLAIEAGDEIVLVDTGFGMGDAQNRRRLGTAYSAMMNPQAKAGTTALKQLEALGFGAGDVRHIVTTHLDIDHTGGLADFPAAEVHVLSAELEAALHPPRRERMRYRDGVHWEHNPNWITHDADGDGWHGFESVRILEGVDVELLLVPLIGHSQGHTGVAIHTDDGWLFHCGDTYFNEGEMRNPPSCPPAMRFFQGLMAADNKTRMENQDRLRELAARSEGEVTMFCSHDPNELEREQTKTGVAATVR